MATLRALFGLGLLGLTLVSGCGYTLVGGKTGTQAPPVLLAVVPFVNQTREPGLENYVTAALRHAILRRLPVRLAAENVATRRLSGIVRHFRAIPVSFTANDTVTQYRLEAEITIRLEERTAGTLLLAQDIAVWAAYLVSETGDVRANTVAKEAAIWRLAQRFADQCTALLTVALLEGACHAGDFRHQVRSASRTRRHRSPVCALR